MGALVSFELFLGFQSDGEFGEVNGSRVIFAFSGKVTTSDLLDLFAYAEP